MVKILKQIIAKIILKANHHYIASFQRSCSNCEKTQRECLTQILNTWADHPIFKNLEISNVDDFRIKMPIQDYESLKPYLNSIKLFRRNKLIAYLKTSGTQSDPKFIPFTKKCQQILKESWTIWGWFYFSNFFEEIDAKILKVDSSKQPRTDNQAEPHNGVPVFTMNVAIESLQKQYVKWRYTKKLSSKKTILFAANPFTLLQYLDSKNLESEITQKPWLSFVTWKHGSMSRYLNELTRKFPYTKVYDPGYQASEGFFAIPMDLSENGAVLNIQRYFFEFLEKTPSDYSNYRETKYLIQSHELEIGKQYLVYVSTYSGLFRYAMYDIIECVGFYENTPRIVFIQKSEEFINLCGEKISAAQIDSCIELLSLETNFSVDLIRVVAVPYIKNHPPKYIAVFFADLTEETSRILKQAQPLSMTMDKHLKEINCEFFQKRKSERILPPDVKVLSKSSECAKYFKIHQKHHAQYKPRSFMVLKETESRIYQELDLPLGVTIQ